MVQIVVRVKDGIEEWCLVELQGELETRDEAPCDGMHIGDLYFDTKGTPNLIIGHHLLTGKVVSLEKPFAVLNRYKSRSNEDPSVNGSSQAGTEYEVVALLTQKIVFKNRPKPIITRTLQRKVM